MVSWATVKTLLFTLGPLLLPKLIGYYNSIRSSNAAHRAPIRATPPRIKRALNILFISAVISLLSTLPPFRPENIFRLTESRLQIPNDVLFVRLSHLRLQDTLTAADHTLKSKFSSLDARLLYLAHGPDPLINCLFCNTDEPKTYLYYTLPAILTPHLIHITLLGLVTSSLLSGPDASIWRTQATVAGTALASLEIYMRSTYDHRLTNTRSTRLSEIDFFHWRMLSIRGLSIAITDIILAYALYLSSTNRAFHKPPSTSERLEQTTRVLEQANKKLQALGITRNVVLRDELLKASTQKYWEEEGRVMREVFETREVLDGVKSVLERVDVRPIEDEAGRYAQGVVGDLQVVQELDGQDDDDAKDEEGTS